MALIVTQGPLPGDGASVDPSVDLEAWISGTQVFGFDYASFKDGTLQFVYSTTDPPAMDARFPGMLWFKRGEGRLYIMDQNNLPSGASSADLDERNWISLSDRKEIWLQAVEPIEDGMPVQLCASDSNKTEHAPDGSGSEVSFFDPFWRVNWDVTVMQSPNEAGTPPGQNAIDNRATDLWFIAMESTDSGGVFKGLELGFCDVLMGSGASGNAGEIGINESASNTMWFQRKTYYETAMQPSSNTLGYIFTAFAVDSSATAPTGSWRRPAFKIPHPPYGVSK
jgi:hypothetical protein